MLGPRDGRGLIHVNFANGRRNELPPSTAFRLHRAAPLRLGRAVDPARLHGVVRDRLHRPGQLLRPPARSPLRVVRLLLRLRPRQPTYEVFAHHCLLGLIAPTSGTSAAGPLGFRLHAPPGAHQRSTSSCTLGYHHSPYPSPTSRGPRVATATRRDGCSRRPAPCASPRAASPRSNPARAATRPRTRRPRATRPSDFPTTPRS